MNHSTSPGNRSQEMPHDGDLTQNASQTPNLSTDTAPSENQNGIVSGDHSVSPSSRAIDGQYAHPHAARSNSIGSISIEADENSQPASNQSNQSFPSSTVNVEPQQESDHFIIPMNSGSDLVEPSAKETELQDIPRVENSSPNGTNRHSTEQKVKTEEADSPLASKEQQKAMEKRARLKAYVKAQLNPKKFSVAAYCCPQSTVKAQALPSEIREVKAEVIEKRRMSRLKKAAALSKAKRSKKLEDRLLRYREQVQNRVDKLNSKRASGKKVNEQKFKKELRKLRFVDQHMRTVTKHVQRYASNVRKIPLRRRIWNFIRGKAEYPPSTVKWKDLAREERDEVKAFLLDVGYALSLYNVPAYRLEYSLTLLAAYYGIELEIQSTPTQILVSFHDFSIDVDGTVKTAEIKGLARSFSTDSLKDLEENLEVLSEASVDTQTDELADHLIDEQLKTPIIENTYKPAPAFEGEERNTEDNANVDSSLNKSEPASPLNDDNSSHSQPRTDFESPEDEANTNELSAERNSDHPSKAEPRRMQKHLPTSEADMFRSGEGTRPDYSLMTVHDSLFKKSDARVLSESKRQSDVDFLVKNSTHFVKIPSQTVDLTKLVQMEDLVDNIHRGSLTIKMAREKVRDIIEAKPRSTYILPIIASIMAPLSFAVLLNANWKEIVAVATSSIFIVILQFFQDRVAAISSLFVTVSALIAGLVAVGYKALFLEVDPDGPALNIFVVALASVVSFFPGLSITVSVNELAEKRYLSGMIRLTGAALQVLKIGFGILLANALAVLLFRDNLAQPTNYKNPWWSYLLAVFVAVMSYSISFRVPPYILAVIFIYIGAYAGFASSVYISGWLGTEFGTLLGAVAVGLSGDIYSRLSTHTSTVVTSPAILLLVPGSLGVSSVIRFSQRDIAGAVEFVFQIFVIAIALVFGLSFGRVFLPKKRVLAI